MDNRTAPTVILRAPEMHRDLDRLFRWELTQQRGYDVAQDAPPAPSRMELWAFLHNYHHSLVCDGQIRFMVDTEDCQEDTVTVGYVDLCDFDAESGVAYVSVFTAESMRRCGYALAALRALAEVAKTMSINRLCAVVSAANEPSQRLFASAGYRNNGNGLQVLNL